MTVQYVVRLEIIVLTITHPHSVTSPVPIPGATENLASPPQNAYDMELPSLH